jgi:hypothetical protein
LTWLSPLLGALLGLLGLLWLLFLLVRLRSLPRSLITLLRLLRFSVVSLGALLLGTQLPLLGLLLEALLWLLGILSATHLLGLGLTRWSATRGRTSWGGLRRLLTPRDELACLWISWLVLGFLSLGLAELGGVTAILWSSIGTPTASLLRLLGLSLILILWRLVTHNLETRGVCALCRALRQE